MHFTTKKEVLDLLGTARESRTLEFKREVHLRTIDDKKEFLRDVTALANTDGGYLLIGIDEQDGVAERIVPVPEPQAFQQTALNLLRYSVKPQIFGLRIWPVEVEQGEYIVVIYVPMSWNRPHMVALKGERGFWGRNEEGKYPLDVATLRSLFLWGQAVEERLEYFRAERVAWLLARDSQTPYALLHFVPFSALQPGGRIHFPNPEVGQLFSFVGGGIFHVNFEGGYIGKLPPDRFASYVQFFRSGAIEMGCELRWETQGQMHLNLGRLDHQISNRWLPALWRYQEQYEVSPPFAWALSLLNIKGLRLVQDPAWNVWESRPENRPHLLFPLQVLETWEALENALRILMPLLDQAWQAFGIQEDPYWKAPDMWKEFVEKFHESGMAQE